MFQTAFKPTSGMSYTGCVSESGDFATLERMLLSPFCCQL